MHWVLQEDLFKEQEFENLLSAFERLDLPYSVHKVIPFIGELLPEVTPRADKIICVGSYSMRHPAKKYGWTPGVYDIFDQNFTVQLEHWGGLMLNADSQVVRFADGNLIEPAFIRPVDDSKYFAGRVFEPAEFNEWREKIVDLGHDYGTSLSADTLIQICRPKEIYAEYRYWIVGGKISTRSLYKRGSKVIYSALVNPAVDEFVTSIIALGWSPHSAYVLDVCETADGVKIVEINTLNAAGFYAGDVMKLVIDLEEHER